MNMTRMQVHYGGILLIVIGGLIGWIDGLNGDWGQRHDSGQRPGAADQPGNRHRRRYVDASAEESPRTSRGEETIKESEMLNALKSRTVWTAIAAGAINFFPQIQGQIPPSALPWVNLGMSALVIAFRVNPSQSFKGTK